MHRRQFESKAHGVIASSKCLDVIRLDPRRLHSAPRANQPRDKGGCQQQPDPRIVGERQGSVATRRGGGGCRLRPSARKITEEEENGEGAQWFGCLCAWSSKNSRMRSLSHSTQVRHSSKTEWRRMCVRPTLTKRGEARTIAQFVNYVHLLVLSPVRRRSGWLPPRPPGPLRVWELCLGTASAMAAPLWGVA